MDALLLTLRNLGPMRLMIMGVVLFGMIGFFVYLATKFTTPQMSLLYSGLEGQDQSAIVAQLQAANVPYELRGGSELFVPQAQVAPMRMQMANQGLPAGGSLGYEIFDKQGSHLYQIFERRVTKT